MTFEEYWKYNNLHPTDKLDIEKSKVLWQQAQQECSKRCRDIIDDYRNRMDMQTLCSIQHDIYGEFKDV